MKIESQAQIYEDISKFIQIFKKCLLFLESIVQNAKRKDQFIVYIERQKTQLKQLLSLAQKYSLLGDSLNIDQSTFTRFSNRLIETISLMKTQLRGCQNSQSIAYLFQLLIKLQKVVALNQNERKFKQLIVDSYWLFLNICSELQQIFLTGEERTLISTSSLVSKEKVLKMIQNKRSQSLNNNEISVICKLKSSSLQQIKKANQPRPESTIINKTIGLINSRYESLKCLDIEYQYFKTSTFEAVQKSAAFQRQYLSRNEQTNKFVKNYHDGFNLFLKKKELKISRKNKKVHLQTDYDYNFVPANHHVQQCKERKDYIKILRGKFNRTLNQRSIAENVNKEKNEEAEIKQQIKKTQINGSYKTLYTVNNMFLIFGRKNNKGMEKKNRKQDKQNQKKVLQANSINLSIFTQDSYKSSPAFRQKPLKQQTNIKQPKRQEQNEIKHSQKQKLVVNNGDQKLQEDSIFSAQKKRHIKQVQFVTSFDNSVTQTSQYQNHPFKIQRTIKYRSKVEPKLRHIIFKVKQI